MTKSSPFAQLHIRRQWPYPDAVMTPPGSVRRVAAGAFAAVVLAGLAACGSAAGNPEQPPTRRAAAPTTPVTVAFAGDTHFERRTARLLADPATAMGPIATTLSAADLAVLNLETAVTTRGTPEAKQYRFRAPATAYDALKAAGVDAVSLANNHTMDYGREGLLDTLHHADARGMPVFGAGRGAREAFNAWTTTVHGTRLAFVGLSQIMELSDRWAARPDRPGIAMAHDISEAVAAVHAARQHADVVIVFVHWGQERRECPIDRQRELARHLAEAGATAIIGAHAHTLMGAGWLGRTYVAYGLGNFLWWTDSEPANDTGVLRLTFDRGAAAGAEFLPARITSTGQPALATGPTADRIKDRISRLRDCAGLAAEPH